MKLCRYTAIDEYSRYRILGAYMKQSTYSSDNFLRRVVAAFARKDVKVEWGQTGNGSEFTNRFTESRRPSSFEETAARLGIRRKLIRPYTPRHNDKVERGHREGRRRFYDIRRFYSLADFGTQLSGHQSASNVRPVRPFKRASPSDVLSSFPVQFVGQTYTGRFRLVTSLPRLAPGARRRCTADGKRWEKCPCTS